MSQQKKRRHHYVPQFYLKQWCNDDNSLIFFSKLYKNFQRKSTKAVAFVDDFYSLPELSDAEVNGVCSFVAHEYRDPKTKGQALHLVESYKAILCVEGSVERDLALSNFAEDIYATKELYVSNLFRKGVDFLNLNDEDMLIFFEVLSIQFTRTPFFINAYINVLRQIGESLKLLNNDSIAMSEDCAGLLSLCQMYPLAKSLYDDFVSKSIDLVIYYSKSSEVKFITSDRPCIGFSDKVLNVLYVVSPSVLIHVKSTDAGKGRLFEIDLGTDNVLAKNKIIYCYSKEQIYAFNKKDLEGVVDSLM